MSIFTLLLYVFTITVLIVIPGPVAIVCLNQGTKYPFKYSIFSAIGGTTASCVIIFVSIIGLGSIIYSNSTIFNGLKMAGGSYLLYLGISYLSNIRKQGNAGLTLTTNQENYIHKGRKKIFMSAFLVGISNPKDIIFFVALFPQFIQPNTSKIMQLFILVLTWIVIDLLVMTTYVAGANNIVKRLVEQRQIHRLELVTGIIFILLACIVMWEIFL